MKKVTLMIGLVLLITAVFTACGGDSSGGAAESGGSEAQTIEVLMNDIYYGETPDNADNPPVWTVSGGSLVNVNANNAGSLEHNWAIVAQGASLPDTIADPADVADLIMFDIGNVAGGETWNSAFDAPAPGEYQVICTVAGHYPAMQGVLVVEE